MDLFITEDAAITDEEFAQILARFELRDKAVLCCSRLLSMGRVGGTEAAERILDVLLDVISPNGTLVLPAYTFSAYRDEVFDPARTRSRSGVLGDVARSRPGFVRSVHPVYSHVCWGKDAEWLCRERTNYTCFGEESLFADFAGLSNSYLLFLGCTLNAATIAHYYDQRVHAPGRFLKTFAGRICSDGVVDEVSFDSFVKDYEFYGERVQCFAGLDSIAGEMGLVNRAKCGQDWIHGMDERFFGDLYTSCLECAQDELLIGSRELFDRYFQNNEFELMKDMIPLATKERVIKTFTRKQQESSL